MTKKLIIETNQDTFTINLAWEMKVENQVWYSIAIPDEGFIKLASSLGMNVENIKWTTHPNIIGTKRGTEWFYEATLEFDCKPLHLNSIELVEGE